MKSYSCRFPVRTLACSLVALLGVSTAFAQPVEWSGGSLATSNNWGLAGNWASGTIPAAGSDIRIATGNFTPGTNGAADTMALNGNREVGSVTFDNSAGQFPSVLRLNANTGNGSNNGTFRNLTINRDASNVVFSVVSGANVFISGNSSTLNNFAGLNLTLNYTGMGTIDIDASSSMIIGGNAAGFRTAAGQNAGLIKSGAGALTMGGASANYTAGFQLAGGTLWVAASSNLTNPAQPGPFGTGSLTIDGGTKLASSLTTSNGNRTFDNPVLFTGGTVTLGDTTNNGIISFTSVNNPGGTSEFQADTVLNVLSTVTLNRAMSGSGSLTKTGAGVLNINQPATYTGGTILREGSIQLGADNLPTTGTVTFDGGTLRVGNTGFTASPHATTVTENGGTFSVSGVLALTWAGDISGVGGLTMAGSGFLNLGGNNTYAGGTNITQGTLRGSIGTGNLTVASGATYGLNGADRSTATISGSGNITLGANTLTTDTGASSSFDGIIAGAGGLTKAGAGTLTLSGVNTYSGTTTVSGGVLNGAIGSGDLSVSAGAAYELGGAARSVAALSGAGNVALGTHTLTTNSTTNSTFSGVIAGDAGLTKEGSGTLTLSGNNTYTGLTAVNGGAVAVNGTHASPVMLAAGTTLSGAGTFLSGVSLSGTHAPGNSPGIQTFADLTYNAGANILWELNANSATQGSMPSFDQIVVNGALNVAGATTVALSFDLVGSSVDWNNAFWSTNQSWLVIDSTSTLNAGNLSLVSANWLDGFGNNFDSVRAGAAFNFTSSGSDVYLNFNVAQVPEPSTYAMIAVGCGMLAVGAWRRRRQA